MEITNEIKAKVFALYWGQEVLYITGEGLKHVTCRWNLKHPDFFLKLKSLSAITDEDAENIAKYYEKTAHNIKTISGEIYFDFYYGDHLQFTSIDPSVAIYAIDYLRSKGYALPYMEYTVEDLVKEGIYKLTE